jgi:hypothetical protein
MSALTDFKTFIADAQAGSQYQAWLRDNSGLTAAQKKQSPLPAPTSSSDAGKWFAFRDAILAGAHPAVPLLSSAHGRELADAGVLYLDASAAPLPSPVPSRHGIGVSTHMLRYSDPGAYLDRLPPTVGLYRDDVTWSGGERVKGTFDWTALDKMAGLARARGKKLMPMIGYAPAWANGGKDDKVGPLNPADFGHWAGAFAGRCASMWADVVDGIELWNEPNINFLIDPNTGAAGPSALYAALVNAAYPAMKAAAPNIKVIAGATAGTGTTKWDEPTALWTEAVLNAVADRFDEWSDHTYEFAQPGNPPETGAQMARIDAPTPLGRTFWNTGVESLAAQLARHGHPGCVIHATETGAPTYLRDGTPTFRGCPEQNVADWWNLSYPRWRSQPSAGWYCPYTGQDPTDQTVTNMENFFGILRSDGSRKPLWDAMAATTP